MMQGLWHFYYGFLNYNKGDAIVLKFETYSRLLRWIITDNNPRYTNKKFNKFREAAKQFWIYLFGNNFHEFWYPLKNKRYYFDRELFKDWLKSVNGY
jgi:hypothetical protein